MMRLHCPGRLPLRCSRSRRCARKTVLAVLLGKDGGDLFEQGSGASRRVFVHWTPDEVKNGVELEFELTGETLELFDLYMKHARPLLCGSSNRYLFPGRGDKPKQPSWFSTQIAQNLARELGVPVTGHQFRH